MPFLFPNHCFSTGTGTDSLILFPNQCLTTETGTDSLFLFPLISATTLLRRVLAILCLSGAKGYGDLAGKSQNAPSLASTIANDSFQRSGQLALTAVLPSECARDVKSTERNNVISTEHNIVERKVERKAVMWAKMDFRLPTSQTTVHTSPHTVIPNWKVLFRVILPGRIRNMYPQQTELPCG